MNDNYMRAMAQGWEMLGDATLFQYQEAAIAIRNWEQILDTLVRLGQAL